MVQVSIITPCFNEELSIKNCIESIRVVMEETGLSYEHIISDNNSVDLTWQILKELARDDSRRKIIRNARNIGPTRNTWNALKFAKGEAIVPFVPADLQDPPEKIPELIAKWQEGFDVVFGIRSVRKESLLMRFVRGVFYFLYNKVVDSKIPKNAGEFLIADKSVIERALSVNGDMPYIRGLISMNAVKTATISYVWDKRKFGKSRNNFWSLFDEAINAFTSTSLKLGRLVLISGIVLSCLSCLLGLVSIVWFALSPVNTPRGIPFLITLFLIFSSYQIVLLGIVAEYTLSIKKSMIPSEALIIAETLNFNDKV